VCDINKCNTQSRVLFCILAHDISHVHSIFNSLFIDTKRNQFLNLLHSRGSDTSLVQLKFAILQQQNMTWSALNK